MSEHTSFDMKLKDFTTNLSVSGLRTSIKLVKTIFGDVTEKNVTFCFDTSGSMYRVFHHCREQLLETLFKMLLSNKGQKFNIVLFNSSIHQFSSKHQSCVQKNIINVIHWMNNPFYESKTNLLGGLLKAFEDDPDVVYLVTDGYINKDRSELLSHLPHISKGRPVKCIMITHKVPPDDTALDFMEDISWITRGSLTVIAIQDFGAVEVVMPIVYSVRPKRGKRSHFKPFEEESIDLSEMRKHFIRNCFIPELPMKTLKGDPMKDLPVIAPFISKDPLSEKRCPFYHPFYQWYWPQFWEGNGPSPTLMWTKNDPQYHSMWSDFRDSRAFICGKKYLDTYKDNEFNSASAGIVLMNRKVLAFNYRENNKIFLGTVINQMTPIYFLVHFEIYNKFNEAQMTNINELIDVEEQKRHSIKINDFVLAPINLPTGPFEIGIVTNGQEVRSGQKGLFPSANQNLKVLFFESKLEKTLEFNVAILISPKLKQIIERQKNILKNRKISSSEKSDEDETDKMENEDISEMYRRSRNFSVISNNNALESEIEQKDRNNSNYPLEDMPCDTCCPHRFSHELSGRINSPVDNGKAKTIKEIDEEIMNRKLKLSESESKDKVGEMSKDLEMCDHSSSDEDETKYSETKNIHEYQFESDDDGFYNHLKDKKDNFTETDLNWCILRLLNKGNKNQNHQRNSKTTWKYWGRKPIPDVIDPPSTEPYNDPPNWGGCPMPKTIVNQVEWPSTTFTTVNPHLTVDYSPKKMYEVFRHESHIPSQRPKRDACVGNARIPPNEMSQFRHEQKFRYLQGGYPKAELKYPNVDSVKPLLCSWSSLNPQTTKCKPEKYLRSIEKSRINAQISRDEMNTLNYLQHKTAS